MWLARMLKPEWDCRVRLGRADHVFDVTAQHPREPLCHEPCLRRRVRGERVKSSVQGCFLNASPKATNNAGL